MEYNNKSLIKRFFIQMYWILEDWTDAIFE